IRLQLEREPYPLPKLRLNPDVKDIFSFRFDDLHVEGYTAHPHIRADISV
ncbi:MAG TPA: thymidylate synthase, partial [Spirochaetia bacterium]